MNKIQSIGIVGFGNVASRMAIFFQKKGVSIHTIIVRSKSACINSNPSHFSFSENYDDLEGSDLVLVCVSDDAIAEVIQKIPPHLPIAYTSGSTSLAAMPLKGKIGVFYPLQTFSKVREVSMEQVPILIESNNKDFSDRLFNFARSYFRRVEFADSEKRKKIHLAAVFVNNFVNHLFVQAEHITQENNVDFNLLFPLIEETAKKITQITPMEAQTGPARRNDQAVIELQRRQLQGIPLELYNLLTASIQKTHNSKEK